MTREEAIKVVKENMHLSYDEGKMFEALKTLVPELRESEDEKVRKELLEVIRHCYEDGGYTLCTDDYKKYSAYLEKQKEQKPTSFNEPYNPDEYEVVMEGDATGLKRKEQKLILEVFGFKVGDAVRLKDGDGRKHIIKSFKEVKGLHGPNFYHVEFEDDSARDSIYPGKQYLKGYYTRMEKFEEEQKPAEWSEEDIKKIRSEEYTKGFNDAAFGVKLIKEWSEEDEQFLLVCKNALQKYQSSDKWDAAIIYSWLEKRLKSLYPQPHWKPSEEQMSALDLASLTAYDDEDKETLKLLYNDLKKLI